MTSKRTSHHIAKCLGKNIQKIRDQKKIRRDDLAAMMGISYQQLYKFEMGQNKISAEQMIVIKYCLDTSYPKLFEGFK